MQQGMLSSSIRAAGHGYYVEQALAEIIHPLDEAVFADCWRVVFEHYEVLQSEFAWEEREQAEQVIREGVELPVELEDRSATPPGQVEAALREFLDSDRRRGFKMDAAPLTRVTLLKWGDNRYHCVWTVHHALADGRAMAMVLRQVFALYDARLAGRDYALPQQPHYREFVGATSGPPGQEFEHFWKGYLAGFSEPSAPPLPPPEPPPEAGIGSETIHLSSASTAALAALAEGAGCTMGTVVQAAWALVLGRYTQRSDVVFGATKSVRHIPQAPPDAVGLFINTLPLRVAIQEDARVKEWLGHVRSQWTALRQHEHSPLNAVHAVSGLRGGTPLFHSVLVYETGSIDGLVKSRGGDWAGRSFQLLERTPGELTLAVYAGDSMQITGEYDQTLYRHEDIARVLQHFANALEGMAANPDAMVAEVEILSNAERELLLKERQPQGWTPRSGTVVDWFVQSAAAHGGRNALEHEGRGMTHAEMERQTARLAEALVSLGAGPGAFVGVSAPRSIAAMVGIMGILRAGAAYVPIDPGYPAQRLDYLCKDSGIALMVTTRELAPLWEGRVARSVYLDEPEAWPTADDAPPIPPPRAEDPAYVIYTSGTTGKPKGVVVHHGALAAFIAGAHEVYGIRGDDRMLQFSSLSFDAAIEEIFLPLCHGLTLTLRTDEMMAAPAAFYAACESAHITLMNLPTAFWNLLAREMSHTKPPACVRGAIIGGEAVRRQELDEWQRHVPAGVTLINGYGPTETAVVATATVLDAEDSEEIPIGRPLPGALTYVLDARLRPVPDGVPGELFVGGAHVALGYHERPEMTAERFVPNPFGEGRVYKTGDRVRYRDDGQLVYLGRQDRQVKLRGFRVELDGVEAVLRSCKGVRDAAVTVYERTPGNPMLVGYVVPANPARLDRLPEMCREEVSRRLPDFMRPSAYVSLWKLPLNNSGKVDYQALPAPEMQDAAPEADDQPQDETEWAMARLWSKVLGRHHFGRHDNFFEVGGNSLLGVVLLGHIERRFGRRLAPLRLYQAPTIASLSRLVEETEEHAPPRVALHPLNPFGNRVPLFFVGSTDLLPAIKPVLGPDQPLYSLNIFGLEEDDGTYKFQSVEDVAAMFVKEIRAAQPNGPYAVGGYCRDSMVAFEMARQLREAGEAVPLVALVDIFWDTAQTYRPLERHCRNIQRMGTSYFAAKWREKFKVFQEGLARKAGEWAERRAGRKGQELSMKHRHNLFIHAYFDTILRYTPKPYDGAVTIYMATEWGLRDTPRWRELCKGGVSIRQVDACHFNIWQHPHADELARLLRDDLLSVSGQAKEA